MFKRGINRDSQVWKTNFILLNGQKGQITSYLAVGDDGNVYDVRLWIRQDEKELNLNGIKTKDFDAPILIEGLNVGE